MPYDQKENPVLDVSGSAPLPKVRKQPPPPAGEVHIKGSDASIAKLAYYLSEERERLWEEKVQTRGSQPGFTKAECQDIVDSR